MKESTYEYLRENFGDKQPIKTRFFNIVCIGATCFSFLATVINLITQTGNIGLIICLVCTLSAMAAFPLSKKIKNLDLLIPLILILINFFILPALYFTVGGIYSGMPLYFVIGIVFTILLIDSIKTDILMVTIELAYYLGVIMIDKAHPEISEKFCKMGDTVYLDTALDFIVVSLCIGVLVKILAVSFERQQAKTDRLLAQMEELAVKDPLTGAYNRRFLMRYLDTGLQNTRESGQTMAVVMFDIDKFKRINDDYGHLVGDEVIKALATTLMRSCRDYDIVSRYGGEEFVLVMPNATEQIALARAESIRETFASLKISPSIDRPVTISGGVGEFKSAVKTPEDLISIADDNLYVAKETGRNKIVGTTYNRDTQVQQ